MQKAELICEGQIWGAFTSSKTAQQTTFIMLYMQYIATMDHNTLGDYQPLRLKMSG